jgi:hypothetical protein
LQRTPQHLRVRRRGIALGEGNAAGLRELPHLGKRFTAQLQRERADGVDTGAGKRARAPAQHVDQPGLVERRIGIRRAGEARHAPGESRVELRLERGLVLEPRLAQARGEIDQAGRDHQAGGIDDALGPRESLRDMPLGDEKVAGSVSSCGRIDDARVADLQPHQLPATMLMTAIRTAMPNVTCGRMTERGPSATVESISTPRFIGPGCITIASLRATDSFSSVRP